MTKSFLHFFLSLLLSLVSLTGAHNHDHSETLAIVETSDSESHCDLCAMKSALHSCQIPDLVSLECLLSFSISFEPSYSSHFIFTSRLAFLRAHRRTHNLLQFHFQPSL
jgi:hypothetical protein